MVDSHREISDRESIQGLLEALTRSRTTNLYLEGAGKAAWPVNVVGVKPGTALILDIGTADELMPMLAAGASCALIGKTLVGKTDDTMVDDTMVKVPALHLLEEQPTRRQQIACEYPELLYVEQRRATFRATVTRHMRVSVELEASCRDMAIKGRLGNLSMGGCLLVLPLADSVALYGERRVAQLSVNFPNGEQLNGRGYIRHVRPDRDWKQGRVGFEFAEASADFERLLAYCIRELDRQRAYEKTRDEFMYTPSLLFAEATPSAGNTRRRRVKMSPAKKELAAISAWLDAQIIRIQAGGLVATRPLLDHGRTLLKLLRHDREALLYAASGLEEQPLPVKHGIAVAIRLADLLEWKGLHTQPLDAVIACALIHDFGKTLLPNAICHAATPYNAEQRAAQATHVKLLTERLHEPEELPAEVIEAVIGQANERLDGSGYPRALRGEELTKLGRIMAVVDVADAMRRDRADRSAWPQMTVYKHMLQASSELDNGWVQRYIRRFGVTPIGSLARYANGTLAWIQRLDDNGTPVQVQVAVKPSGEDQAAGATIDGEELVALGQLDALVDPREHGLV